MILKELKSGVLEITLNRPEVLNSFNRQMAKELLEALQSNDSRAVLLTGAGRGFCAGQDLADVCGDLGEIVKECYNPIIKAIRNLPKPVVCVVNGVAAGAGANIALSCDIVFAQKGASFIQSFSKVGLVPDSGGTFFLPRLVGLARATALTFLADKISAEEAENIGLIYKASDNALEDGRKCAEMLASGATKGFALTKELLNQSFENTLDKQLKLEEEYQSKAGSTYDYKEGVSAFLEKRPAKFTGN
jgi:2-(1,2-epoxy-1,2-dihydrophenyl)acetyl-CoA isomerase